MGGRDSIYNAYKIFEIGELNLTITNNSLPQITDIINSKLYKIGGTLKMGQQNVCSCGTIEAEATMPCTNCPNKSTSVIKTPNGYICPDCYKRLYVEPTFQKVKIPA